ncbi:MAG: transglycosylase SLT domain-containing protein [Bacteroidia bacterium]|nr:transglycosylase SLT domain-containing protein [Bacteroidia bacterium]
MLKYYKIPQLAIVVLFVAHISTAQSKPKTREQILSFSDSVCRAAGVPEGLIRDIGNNETGWRFIRDFSGGTAHGDLQIVNNTFNHWYKKLNLKGGKTRENYLIVGIYYLKFLHKQFGSWQKARYAYARGHWKEPTKWSQLEKKFMGKIDWAKYDSVKVSKKDTVSP